MNQASVPTLEPAVDQRLVAATPDQRLVSAVRDGDDRAFEQLYGRYRSRVRAFALRMTRDPDRADDLVQDIFIAAFRRLRETDTPIVFRPWIYEIARNACIDDYRRRRRVNEVPIEGDGIEGWLDQLTGGPSPDVAMESKQQLENLRDAFRGLSERHHRIIVARELEGKTYRQIGDELEMSQVVVESTLFRARRRLAEEFEELSTGRRCEQVHRIIGTTEGRRLGIRERRAVNTHIEHCGPCRREALAAGWNIRRRPMPSLQKVAAALFPVPLLRFLRFGHSTGPLGPGRMAAAVAAVVAGVSGGLLTQPGAAPAHPRPRHVAASTRSSARVGAGERRLAVAAAGSALRARPDRRRDAAGRVRRAGRRPGPGLASGGSSGPSRSTAHSGPLGGVTTSAPAIGTPSTGATTGVTSTLHSATSTVEKTGAAARASVTEAVHSLSSAVSPPHAPSTQTAAGQVVPTLIHTLP